MEIYPLVFLVELDVFKADVQPIPQQLVPLLLVVVVVESLLLLLLLLLLLCSSNEWA